MTETGRKLSSLKGDGFAITGKASLSATASTR